MTEARERSENEMAYECLRWAIVGASICIVALITLVWAYNTLTNKYAMENGYSRQTLPGATGTYWVKDGEKL